MEHCELRRTAEVDAVLVAVAVHETRLEIRHGITVVNTDVEIEVRADGRRLGTLKISRGSIDWITSPKQIPRRLSWERFAELAEEYGRRPRATR
jgi:hypothetical protein